VRIHSDGTTLEHTKGGMEAYASAFLSASDGRAIFEMLMAALKKQCLPMVCSEDSARWVILGDNGEAET
jgi:hypothetical protein